MLMHAQSEGVPYVAALDLIVLISAALWCKVEFIKNGQKRERKRKRKESKKESHNFLLLLLPNIQQRGSWD